MEKNQERLTIKERQLINAVMKTYKVVLARLEQQKMELEQTEGVTLIIDKDALKLGILSQYIETLARLLRESKENNNLC